MMNLWKSFNVRYVCMESQVHMSSSNVSIGSWQIVQSNWLCHFYWIPTKLSDCTCSIAVQMFDIVYLCCVHVCEGFCADGKAWTRASRAAAEERWRSSAAEEGAPWEDQEDVRGCLWWGHRPDQEATEGGQNNTVQMFEPCYDADVHGLVGSPCVILIKYVHTCTVMVMCSRG